MPTRMARVLVILFVTLQVAAQGPADSGRMVRGFRKRELSRLAHPYAMLRETAASRVS